MNSIMMTSHVPGEMDRPTQGPPFDPTQTGRVLPELKLGTFNQTNRSKVVQIG
jgi:hypothetical protein